MTTSKPRYDFDFAVAGGGPAGSSAAISLAQRGHSVVLFERETFPRFHIGESLLSTANDAFAALGVTKKIEKACFPKKWVREFTSDAAILEVASRGDAASGRVRVRALVDATGRGGLLARKFNLRTEEPRLANIAIFSHYTNVPRLEGPRPDDIRLIARDDAGWFWLIPISKELTSVGVVLPKALYRRLANGSSSEETLNRTISETPVVAELMRNAQRQPAYRRSCD